MEGIGEQLKRARQKRNITIDSVYKDIRIHPKILEAFEEDRLELNIGEVYTKAFLKRYASYLGLDGDRIVQEFEKALSTKKRPEKIINIEIEKEDKTRFIIIDRVKKSALPIITALALIFAISLLGYAGYRSIKKLSASLAKAREDTKETAPQVATAAAVSKKEPLILKAETKDSVWLRVKSDGKTIFEHTLPKGSLESWNAQEKLELWIGRPEALELTLNDKHLELPAKSRIKKIIIDHNGLRIEKK